MPDRAPLDLDAIELLAKTAAFRRSLHNQLRLPRLDRFETADAMLVGDLAGVLTNLVARVRELEKMAEAATEVARHIRCEQHADSDYGRRCCIYCALRRALAEAGYET